MSGERLRIGDLPRPIVAAKSNWDVADVSLDFTPRSASLQSREALRSSVARQAQGGLIIEYISKSLQEDPNPGFESDPDYLAMLKRREKITGKLIAVHRIRASARPLSDVIGKDTYEKLQNAWDKSGLRNRWSVAFPIIESFDIIDPPDAETVLGANSYRRIFRHLAAGLRPLTGDEPAALADLVVEPRPAKNMWIAIEEEAAMADGGGIDPKIMGDMDDDLAFNSMEGLTEEQKRLVRKRVHWLANRFWVARWRSKSVTCDKCQFDPVARSEGTGISPRSLMDVHHTNPLAEGVRFTSRVDFQLLCPNCHRFVHAILRLGR